MQPMPGDSRRFSVLTTFIVATSVACTLGAAGWAAMAPGTFEIIESGVLLASHIAVLAVILTNGFGTLSR